MSENLEVNQTAAFGSHGNTIIGTVNTGLSVTDAMQMALQIFREYYPQLKKEAIDELQKMLKEELEKVCLLYTSPSPRDGLLSRMPSSA